MKFMEQEIKAISNLRETKGKETETLEKIEEILPSLIEHEEWKSVAKMYWEAHLVWQHTAMNEMSKPSQESNPEVIQTGTNKMMEFALKAKDVIEEHNIEDMLGGAYRFMGRAATYANNHEEAKKYYETAIENYSGKNLKSKLEVGGFLSESLIRLGESEQGVEMAKKIYKDYYESEIGKALKEEDYFTWAVWMSGIAPRTVKALKETNADYDEQELTDWLEETKKELQNPSGHPEWGDSKFQIRIDEINTALDVLK